MVDIFLMIGTIAILIVVGYVLFIFWKLRKWLVYRLMPHDMRANAMYQAVRDPDADERVLLYQSFTGAMVVGQSFKRFIPSIILVVLLVAAPMMYMWGPGYQGAFGEYDVTSGAIEDTFVVTDAIQVMYGEQPFLRVGNVWSFEGFRFTNSTAYTFVRFPMVDGNASFTEVGMFRWLGATNSASPDGSYIMACPISLNWDEGSFNFVEFALQSDEALGGGVFCSGTFVPDNIGWVWWNMTGKMGTNDTIMFIQIPTLRGAWHAFDSTEAARGPVIHTIYEGFGPPEKPIWVYGAYILAVLVIWQVAMWQWKKRKRTRVNKNKYQRQQ